MTKQQIISEIRTLPRAQQVDLVMDLWDEFELQAGDLPLTDDQKKELDRRLAAANSDPAPMEDFEVVRDKLLRGDF
jgi:putative addiction module component (TIGR02574 family)